MFKSIGDRFANYLVIGFNNNVHNCFIKYVICFVSKVNTCFFHTILQHDILFSIVMLLYQLKQLVFEFLSDFSHLRLQ